LAKRACQWEFQARIQQCCGFTRTRRADDDVPGLLVNIAFGATRLAQRGERGFQLLRHRRQFPGSCGVLRPGGGNAGGQLVVAFFPQPVERQVHTEPDGEHHQNEKQADNQPRQHGQERCEKPHQSRQHGNADKAQEPAGF
jgi:hypothetical protein